MPWPPFIPLPGVLHLVSPYDTGLRDASSPLLLPLPPPWGQAFPDPLPLPPGPSGIQAAPGQGSPSAVLTTPQGPMLRYTWFDFSCGA